MDVQDIKVYLSKIFLMIHRKIHIKHSIKNLAKNFPKILESDRNQNFFSFDIPNEVQEVARNKLKFSMIKDSPYRSNIFFSSNKRIRLCNRFCKKCWWWLTPGSPPITG